MPTILLVETATRVCSVGIASDKGMIAMREDQGMQYSHSTQLTTFIESVVKEAGLTLKELDAVAVSKGPGSYTGLRIGVSAAKGLCYGLNIPLVAINTLEAMAHMAQGQAIEKPDYWIPMIDARRMEVYNAVFDSTMQLIRETMAEIITPESFSEFLQKGKTAFFGDGSPKCKEVITHPNAMFFDNIFPSVAGMLQPALEKLNNKNTEDVAYFEPFYLKDFVAGKPRVKGLE